jgi:glutamate racemase
MSTQISFQAQAPIGIFDSGVGGLSVLQHIRALLPDESLLYFADSGNAPYGDKPESFIIERCLAIADFFIERGVKAIVVACNTATAQAIAALRARYPDLVLVGIEPGLKPAAQLSQSKIVGVMATQGTLQSQKFRSLRDQLALDTGVEFVVEACSGLATQIEKAEPHSAETILMVRRYLTPLLHHGADVIVLGCTHYPFVSAQIKQIAAELIGHSDAVRVIDTGEAVARHLQRLLVSSNLLTVTAATEATQPIQAWTTGDVNALNLAFERLLLMHAHERCVYGLARG